MSMNKITGKKQFLLIGFAFIWALFQLACGPQVNDKKPVKAKKEPVSITKIKKPRKVEKPAPVFQPQATITMADGKVYEVADFAFYSKHRSFEGGFYTPRSGSTKWFLYLKQGPIWEKIDFARVKSLTISKSSRVGWLKIDLVQLDGTKLKGLHPFYAYKNLWHKHGVVYLIGKAEVLGRPGNFKCQLAGVLSLEKLDAGEKDAPPTFKVIHNIKEKNETIITNPGFKLTWKKVTPTYLDVYKLKTNMPVTVNNTEIKIKPGEIETVTVPQKSSAFFTVKMKQGETVKIKLPPRVFGKLENGDILFTDIFEKGKPVVQEIKIK
ncbi:MAG: hypothetical protein GTO45_29485 [Candidatus Aminicenantes bacterium]|nr:hypothetical protein [Candidatus Aminicenantes bacterium]NIM82927.1 hypothetical protein [Candidatus Aminicenantes bacterium]NIN22303.1 hypothetical protein [Candidatus Aminicenantes bacterium]NIN46071.1 hypothetical protein [Candidatus Aminicenantes bacterium]NIN88907.1 hypothetical protein [Candidatus Aminicenantes bacterium]